MSEQAFNIKFVRIIRKYPCIYDHTGKEYCMRSLIDQAWNSIAKEVGEDVKTCKERWKNIRTVYRRNIVLCQEGGAKKPYYLFDEMRFMLPFLQKFGRSILGRTKEEADGNSQDDQGNNEDSLFDVNGDNDKSMENDSAEDPLNVVEAVIKSQPREEQSVCMASVKNEQVPDDDVDQKGETSSVRLHPKFSTSDYFHPQPRHLVDQDWDPYRHELPSKKRFHPDCNCSIEDPNQQFLMSLKPDLEQMDMAQKRRFKRGIFDLITNILDNEQNETKASSSS